MFLVALGFQFVVLARLSVVAVVLVVVAGEVLGLRLFLVLPKRVLCETPLLC